MLSGCGAGKLTQRLNDAATRQGEARAKIASKRLPDECYQIIPHATLIPGEELVVLLDAERVQKSRESASKLRCSKTSDELAEAVK